ncbi:Carnitine O-palmitoyltransferase 1, liver isoform [Nymphon striatum]|nr:Carnitine O-palmitoyltransferase 1, liver isoform [Nymphon striatum]
MVGALILYKGNQTKAVIFEEDQQFIKMAEAHSAVAFSVTVTHEGLNINYDWELFVVILKSGLRSWSKRVVRFKNNLKNGVYPGSLHSLVLAIAFVISMYFLKIDMSCGIIPLLERWLPGQFLGMTFGLLVFGLLLWLATIQILKWMLKLLLNYKGWMYEKRGKRSKVSLTTKAWAAVVKYLTSGKPLLYSFQSSLPRLPLPCLHDTVKRYLKSMQPLKTDAEFKRLEQLAEEFEKGIGRKLQMYLWFKAIWVSNYVTDWWEEYVYLQSRTPIMVNSNFYGIDAVFRTEPTKPASRAANIVHISLKFRSLIDRQSLEPIKVGGMVPLCSWQYERLFNTCRIPGLEKDKIIHNIDSGHIIVMNKGKFYKVIIHHRGKLLRPAELQIQMEKILNDTSEPAPGEKYLGALTAADRTIWANARCTYFRKGLNNFSLQLIEKAAFVLCLDDESYHHDPPSQPQEPFLNNAIPKVPMTHVRVDLFDALGKTHVTMVDRFSGYIFTEQISNSSTSSVTRTLLKWFQDFGFPDCIRSDGGPCFRLEFRTFCEKHLIKHDLPSAFNPTSNSLAEAAVKNAKRLIMKCKETGESFEKAISEFRLMPRADGYSPADLMFGRSPRGSLPSIRTQIDRDTGRKARQNTLEKSCSRHSYKPNLPCLHVGDVVLTRDGKLGTWSRRGIIVANDPSKLSKFGRSMLHGNGYNRWFDKSFNLIVGSNGRIGFNGEHAWADAPVMSHYWEYVLVEDYFYFGYNEDGTVKGTPEIEPPEPIRLQWDLPEECRNVINECKLNAEILLNDVDLEIYMHSNFGKGIMKSCQVSPDAFIQMGLQLAYFRDQGNFQLTYEASMTRLFKEGRTETIRSVSMESCDWVRAMENENSTKEECKSIFRKACDLHQFASQEAMAGKGIDRHLFCLYVIGSYLDADSPFLKEFIGGRWKLSTSQTPHGQTIKMKIHEADCISAGGGFGPVADDGYGVSYIIAGEDAVFFHVSSKKSMTNTNSIRFVKAIEKALSDIRFLYEDSQ